jgi:hypothetical protein
LPEAEDDELPSLPAILEHVRSTVAKQPRWAVTDSVLPES